MLIIACDYHPSMQQVAWADTETGECGERRLTHCAEAEQFYRARKQQGTSVRVGMEATGQSRWFERLLAELNFELWIGDPAQIRAKQVRKQKYDRRVPSTIRPAHRVACSEPSRESFRKCRTLRPRRFRARGEGRLLAKQRAYRVRLGALRNTLAIA